MRRKRNKKILPTIIVLAFVSYMGYQFIAQQSEFDRLEREKDNIEDQIAYEENQNNELKERLAMCMDPTYIEKEARERLGYVYPNEKVFIDIGK